MIDYKKIFWTLAVTLGACLFFGITIISIAGGAIYPPINRIAQPFVCPNGSMEYNSATYNSSPGESTTTITWVCTPPGGQPREIGLFELVIPAGIIDGLIAFFPIISLVFFRGYRSGAYLLQPAKPAAPTHQNVWQDSSSWNQTYTTGSSPAAISADDPDQVPDPLIFLKRAEEALQKVNQGQEAGPVENVATELLSLKQLLAQGLITQQDYDQKKAEILKRL